MIVKVDKRFEKDVKDCKDEKAYQLVIKLIEFVKQVKDISQIKNIKKLQGYKNYYRIREGNYRIGVEISDNEIIFIRFLHRKNIYKKWP